MYGVLRRPEPGGASDGSYDATAGIQPRTVAPMHEPTDALAAPRFTGIRTFARLPHVPEIDGADAAIFGMPWDGGTSFRSGSRFGPEAIRSASALLRPYNTAQNQMVFGHLSCVDAGDAPTVPG